MLPQNICEISWRLVKNIQWFHTFKYRNIVWNGVHCVAAFSPSPNATNIPATHQKTCFVDMSIWFVWHLWIWTFPWFSEPNFFFWRLGWFIVKSKSSDGTGTCRDRIPAKQRTTKHLFNIGTGTAFSFFTWRGCHTKDWCEINLVDEFKTPGSKWTRCCEVEMVMEAVQGEWRAPAAKPLCKSAATLFDKQQHRFVYMQSLARHCAHSPAVRAESC